MSFFRQIKECVENITIDSKSCKLMICMDNSGSTSGDVLEQQKTFARTISTYFSNVSIVKWDSHAHRVSSLDHIYSSGGTEPSCAIPLIVETNPDFLLFMTDGQIGSVESFRAALLATTIQCPTIVCLTVNGYSDESDASKLYGVNMSIVEAFMSASQDVAIVLNFCQNHSPLLLNGTGIFARFVARLEGGRDPGTATFSEMTPFNFGQTVGCTKESKSFVITLQRSSRAILFIESLNAAVDLNELQKFLSTFSNKDAVFDLDSEEEQMQLAAVLEKLCERMVLPKIDPATYLTLLHGISAAIERKRGQQQIQTKNFEILQLKMQIAIEKEATIIALPLPLFEEEEEGGEDEEKPSLDDLVAKLKEAQTQLIVLEEIRDQACVSPTLMKAIDRLRTILTVYKQDKTKFTYEMGSTRANAATDIDAASLSTLGKCAQGECPVMLTKSDLCILLQISSNKKPEKKESDDDDNDKKEEEEQEQVVDEEAAFKKAQSKMVAHCTRDIFIDSALLFGAETFDVITPGIISVEFAKEYNGKHPLTGSRVIGFVPLSYDLTVFRKYLCMLLCGGKEMFHVVPAYVAMIAKNMRQHHWTNKHVLAHARYILDSLLVRCRFIKSATTAESRKAKIAEAFKPKKGRRVAKHTKTVKKFIKTLDINKEVTADEGVTLREAIQYQLTNYRTCLSQVAYTEARSMVNIAIQLMPEFKFPVAQVLSFIGTLNSLRVVRAAYISDPSAITQGCVFEKNSVLRRMIATMCFHDYFKNKSVLRCMKFQPFWLEALDTPVFGPLLTRLYNGESVSKEEMEALCLKQTPCPSFIDYESKEYKKCFVEHLHARLTNQSANQAFKFGDIDIIPTCRSILKQSEKMGKQPTFAQLQERLQQKFGLLNPTLYSAIIQRQVWIAFPQLSKLAEKYIALRSKQYYARICDLNSKYQCVTWTATKQSVEHEKEENALKIEFRNIVPSYNPKKQQRKEKRKEKKQLAIAEKRKNKK